ncbi:nitroreductase family protein [Agarilytica rhodophyticola]|uniref:nitroreductase family protein n=1 Tax=Agarilytica rhodophyticola TaxID=1737490 RepID=UPI000B344FC7|nr:nitroreductase family protein [Agarilytica rhodophyticola]
MQSTVEFPEDVIPLFEAALLAPSSFNLQHWLFVLIENKTTIKLLLEDTKLSPDDFTPKYLVVVCGDLYSWRDVDNCSKHLDQEQLENARKKSSIVYSEHPTTQRDEVFRSCGLGITNFLWKAEQQGFNHMFIQNIDHDLIRREINLPTDKVLVDIFALDKNMGKNTQFETKNIDDMLINDSW